MDDPADEGPRPKMRSPTHTKVRSPKHKGAIQSRRGVSPPPLNKAGWADMGNGWQKHRRTHKWLRKPSIDGPVYFYVPDDSLWMTMPNGLFMCLDGCKSVLADSITTFNSSLVQLVFRSWKCKTSVTQQWRHKIGLFNLGDSAGSCESYDAYASAEDCRFTSSDACLVAESSEEEEEEDEEEAAD